MEYIQYSTLSLPDDADRAIVFPFLAREEISAGVHRYRFSLLVSDRNHFAQAMLRRLGFVKDPDEKVPDGMGLDATWSFFRCGDAGPLEALSEEAGAAHPFATYLAIEFDAGSTFRPTLITVADSTLNASEFNPDFNSNTSPWFHGLPLKSAAEGTEFSWAAADSTTDTALSFLLASAAEIPNWDGNSKIVKLNVSFERRADGATWGGGFLKLNADPDNAVPGEVIVGNPGDRLITDEGILASRIDDGSISIYYEVLPTTAIQLPLGGSGLFMAELSVQAIGIRFDSDPVGLFLFPSPTGGGVPLQVRLVFPLIMAPLQQAADALALVIPLVDQASGETPPLDFSFTFLVGEDWEFGDQPIFVLQSRSWEFNEQFFSGNTWDVVIKNKGKQGLSLGGLTLSLADLLGDVLGPVGFSLLPPSIGRRIQETIRNGVVHIPMGFELKIAEQKLQLQLSMRLDLRTLRLSANKLSFRFPESVAGEAAQIIDLHAFAIMVPTRRPDTGEYVLRLISVAGIDDLVDEGRSLVIVALVGTDLHVRIFDADGVKVVDKPESDLVGGQILDDLKSLLNSSPFPVDSTLLPKQRRKILRNAATIASYSFEQFDGTIDFAKREFRLHKSDDPDLPAPWIILPGGLTEDFDNRLIFELQDSFRPDSWTPEDDGTEGEPCYFRINGNGLSFHAKIVTSHNATVFRGDESRTPLDVRPHEERSGLASQIVVIDNAIRQAAIFGEMDVPGFDDLIANVEVGLRQKKKGEPPILYAAIDLDTSDGAPLAQMTAGYLQVSLDDLRAELKWDTGNNDWDLKVIIDGTASLSPKITSTGGLDNLKKRDAIIVRDLDLMNLHNGAGSIALHLERPVGFSCLDGMFAVSLDQLELTWGSTFVLACETASFTFKNPGSFDVTIEVGGVHLEFTGGGKLKMRNPSRIGIDAVIGDAVRFRGAVAWVDNDRERYFAAAGTLSIEGLPEATTLLKIGSGVKENGQVVPNIVLYGAIDEEITLFSGVVAKSFGAGIGINNRLAGIGERPNAESMLANIDRIDPSRIDGWEFVQRNGFYLSIVGTTILASNEGGNDSQNAYVASLVLSVDIDLNIVAAGKLWLFSSVNFVRRRANWNRPTLVGAIAMLPRERIISAAFESRPNPAIETNDQLARILNKGRIKLSFLMSPSLVDFFLEEVSYRDEFLGVQMEYRGSMRLAVFRGTVLLRASQSITGHFSRTLGGSSGGFSAQGDLMVLVEFGGLISGRGLAAYALVDIGLNLRVSAFIKIEFSFTIGFGRWKKRISFSITFRLPATQLEIGLRGAVAFDESGKFGFAGSMSISVSICGYRLSISPSLRFNDGVITEVRNRVAAFERRIEAHRQKLLGGGVETVSFALHSAMFADIAPKYLLYEVNGWHLLIPRADEQWLAPRAELVESESEGQPIVGFSNAVEQIEILDVDSEEVLRHIYTPWLRNHWKHFDNSLTDHLEEIEIMMAETKNAANSSKPQNAYVVKTDPRVESTSREYWTDEDRIRLPDYSLPIRMRSADQLLSGDTISSNVVSDYERLVDYLYWRTRASRIQRHEGEDIEDSQRVLQNRGAILQRLVSDELPAATDPTSSTDPVRSAWIATQKEAEDSIDFYGYLFQLPADKTLDDVKFCIKRQNSAAEDIAPIQPVQALQTVREMVRLLPPRQQFVVDREATDTGGTEQGRVIVKLPVAYASELFTDHLPTISHFQVWRQIVPESGVVPEATLVGDIRHPDSIYVDDEDGPNEQNILVVGPYIFTDEFRTEDRDLMTPGIIPGVTEIKYSLKIIPVGSIEKSTISGAVTHASVKLHIPQPDTFPEDLGVVFPVSSLYLPDDPSREWAHFALASIAEERTTLAAVRDDSGNGTRPLRANEFEIWADKRPIAPSGFYAGADDMSGGNKESKADALIDDVRVATTSDRFETIDGKFRVQFMLRPGAKPGNFTIDTSHASELLEPGSSYRFYLRPTVVRRDNAEGERTAFGLLRPLSTHLVRELPEVEEVTTPPTKARTDWIDPPRLRLISQLEWIPQETVDLVTGEQFSNFRTANIAASHRPFDPSYLADELPETRKLSLMRSLRWNLGLNWHSGDVTEGGVEILVRDRDDSAIQDRVLVETLHEDVFRQRVRSFENASTWDLTRLEVSKRLGWLPSEDHYEPPGGDYVDPATQLLFVDDKNNPALANLARRSGELTQVLRSNDSDWEDVLVVAKNFMTSVYVFRKSPLNINDEPVREAIARIELLLRCLVLGMRDSVVSNYGSLQLEARQRIEKQLSDLLVEIDEASIDAADFDDETEAQRRLARAAFIDLEIAKKLVAIIRRRDVMAEEMFSTSDDRTPFPAGDLGPNASWLPRGERFESFRQRSVRVSNELSADLELTSKVLGSFPASESPKITSTWAATLLETESDPEKATAIDTLNELALFEFGDEQDKQARRNIGASIVTKGAGLTVATNRLRQILAIDGWKLVKRPHHQVGVAEGEDGTKEPQAMSITALLSDEARLAQEVESNAADADDPSKEAIAYFNLLERMGFALDIAVINDSNERISQRSLLDLIDQAELPRLLAKPDLDDHYIFVIVGREPDSEFAGTFPDADSTTPFVGHSFMKLAVVPRGFHDLLVSRLEIRATDPDDVKERIAGEDGNLVHLKKWFEVREITLGESSEERLANLVRVGKVAGYVGPNPDDNAIDRVIRVRVESRDRRWLSAPSVDGHTRVRWSAPDQKGRRLRFVARHVPRYEPIIRWSEGMPLASEWGTVEGVEPNSDISLRRLAAITGEPNENNFDLPEFLPVSAYPHPDHLLFSIILPSAGARSIYNVISAVRTGYKGYSLSFRHKLADSEAKDGQLHWEEFLKKMVLQPPGIGDPINDPPAIIKPTPFRNIADVRLFRHERLVTLPDLPYYYQYRMEAQSQFDVHYAKNPPYRGEPWPVSSSRPPGYISCRKPRVELLSSTENIKTYKIDLYLTRTGDLLTPNEWSNSPPIETTPVNVNTTEGDTVDVELPHDRLPEPSLAYRIYSRVGETAIVDGEDKSVYLFLCELLMPWHQDYELDGPLLPWFHALDGRVGVLEERPQIVFGRSQHSNEADLSLPAYVVTLRFTVTKQPDDDEFIFDDHERRRFQVSRLGKQSDALPLTEDS